jgi:hypothetical protein
MAPKLNFERLTCPLLVSDLKIKKKRRRRNKNISLLEGLKLQVKSSVFIHYIY